MAAPRHARPTEDVAKSRIHASDESAHSDEIERMIVAQIRLLEYLADQRRG